MRRTQHGHRTGAGAGGPTQSPLPAAGGALGLSAHPLCPSPLWRSFLLPSHPPRTQGHPTEEDAHRQGNVGNGKAPGLLEVTVLSTARGRPSQVHPLEAEAAGSRLQGGLSEWPHSDIVFWGLSPWPLRWGKRGILCCPIKGEGPGGKEELGEFREREGTGNKPRKLRRDGGRWRARLWPEPLVWKLQGPCPGKLLGRLVIYNRRGDLLQEKGKGKKRGSFPRGDRQWKGQNGCPAGPSMPSSGFRTPWGARGENPLLEPSWAPGTPIGRI